MTLADLRAPASGLHQPQGYLPATCGALRPLVWRVPGAGAMRAPDTASSNRSYSHDELSRAPETTHHIVDTAGTAPAPANWSQSAPHSFLGMVCSS